MYKQLEYTTKHKPKVPSGGSEHNAERERKRKNGNRYKSMDTFEYEVRGWSLVVVGLMGKTNDIADATIFMFMRGAAK